MTHKSDEPEELTYDEAVALLPDEDRIHTTLDTAGILIGADWSRTAVIELLRDSPRRELTGPVAQSMGHGLAAAEPVTGRIVFIETRQEEEAK